MSPHTIPKSADIWSLHISDHLFSINNSTALSAPLDFWHRIFVGIVLLFSPPYPLPPGLEPSNILGRTLSLSYIPSPAPFLLEPLFHSVAQAGLYLCSLYVALNSWCSCFCLCILCNRHILLHPVRDWSFLTVLNLFLFIVSLGNLSIASPVPKQNTVFQTLSHNSLLSFGTSLRTSGPQPLAAVTFFLDQESWKSSRISMIFISHGNSQCVNWLNADSASPESILIILVVHHQNLLDLLICFQETTKLIFISDCLTKTANFRAE